MPHASATWCSARYTPPRSSGVVARAAPDKSPKANAFGTSSFWRKIHTMRTSTIISLIAGTLLLAGCAGHSHYSDLQTREIKSLSDADIAGYRAGQGMRMALPAELNGYPGPLHVLELAEKLALSAKQRQATQQLYERMRSAAVSAGESLIAAEREMDRMFASRNASEQGLAAHLAKIAQAQARLRGVHLQAHLEQVRILKPEQVSQYNRLRGYGG